LYRKSLSVSSFGSIAGDNASESPSTFVRCNVQRQKGGVIWTADLYEHYQKWCRKHSVSPSRSIDFMRMENGTIETTFGLSPRHDLVGKHGTARRGWSALMVEEAGETIENQSVLSEAGNPAPDNALKSP
jgi:hypothetical protein